MPTRKFRTPRVYRADHYSGRRPLRQLFVVDLGHEEPTILLTNRPRHLRQRQLLTRYAQRMLIENALSDAVRFFHMDALSSAVGMKVDFDMTLLVIASGLYRLLARRMRGYADAQARHIFRDLIDTPADVSVTDSEVQVHFHRRAHLPIVLASGLMKTYRSTMVGWIILTLQPTMDVKTRRILRSSIVRGIQLPGSGWKLRSARGSGIWAANQKAGLSFLSLRLALPQHQKPGFQLPPTLPQGSRSWNG